MTADILARVRLNTQDVDRGVSGIKGKLGGLRDTFKGVLGAGLVLKGVDAAVAGVQKLAGEVGKVRDAGSDLQQSSGAVEAVFGKYTKQINQQAKAAEQGLGLSQNAYKELATVMGAGFKNKGLKDYQGATRETIKLGADLAAQFGGDTKTAVEAISSLMRGETDPIEQYGVSINEAAISAELLARGQSKLKGPALEQAKAQARLALLFRQTKDAQGAFAREGGSLANVQQRNAAAMENLRAKLGTALLPLFTAGANTLSTQVIPVLDKVVTWASANLPGALKAAQAALGPVISAVVTFATQLFAAFQGGGLDGFVAQVQPVAAAVMTVFSSLGTLAQAVLPIILQVFTAIVAGVQSALPALQGAYANIASTITSIASIITSVWAAIGPTILPIITSVFGTIITVIGGALNIVAGIFKTIAAVLRGDWSGAWEGIKQIVSGAWTIIKAVVVNGAAVVRGVVSAAVNSIRGQWSAAWAGIRAIVSAVWGAIRGVVSAGIAAVASVISSRLAAIRATVSSAWNVVKSTTSAAWSAIKSAVSSGIANVVSVVRSLPGKAKAALGNIGSALHSAGVNLVRGFANGISSSLGFIADRARAVARAAVNAAKSALGIQSPSKVFRELGAYTGQGFAIGLRGTEAQIVGAMKTLSTKLQAVFKERRTNQRNDLIDSLESRLKRLRKNSKRNAKAIRSTERELKSVRKSSPTNQAATDVAKLTARYAGQVRALQANAKARAGLTARIDAERSKLADLQKQQADFRANVRGAAEDYAGLLTVSTDGPQTVGNITQQLQERYLAVRSFTDNMAKLREKGLNRSYLEELFSGGVEKSGDTVNALLTASSDELAEVNRLQAQIAGQAGALGNLAGDALYGAGVAAQQGLVNGLLADQKRLEAAAAKIANTLTAAVKKALGIKSPSRVFAQLGKYSTDGLVLGLDARKVDQAGQSVSAALVRGFGDPNLSASVPAAAAGAGGPSVVQEVTVEVRVEPGTNPAEVGRAIAKSLKAYKDAGGRLAGVIPS